MKIDLLTASTKKADITISEATFGKDFNESLVHQAVVSYMAGSRQGSSKHKTRSEVRGGGKKPYAQKGTGRARAGTIRSPLWRGGGVTFAATPRDYSKKINKKMYRSAMRSIWSKLAEEGRIIVIEDFSIETPPKSSQIKLILSNLGFTSALAVLATSNEALSLASKNLEEFNIQTLNSINPAELLSAKQVILTSETLESLSKVLS